MKRLFTWLVSCLMLFALPAGVFAQNQARTISGTIKDNAGEPLGGTSVIDLQTKNGTITDANGKFTLEIKSDSQILFSFMGFLDQKISASEFKDGSMIIMKPDSQFLKELVVVGYGTQKKATLTGAVSQISSEEVVTTKNESLGNAIAGKIAGVRVVQNSSEPGSYNSSIDIRGLGNPLIVVDGVPRDDMQRINPEDVETISVLKDASAAIYGVRAANGVILITTKKGSSKPAQVSYNGNFAFQIPSNFPDLVEAADWMVLFNELRMHGVDGGAPEYSQEQIDEYRSGKKQSTDWQGTVLKDFAPQTQHSVNISGGNSRFHYYTSLGYIYQGSFFKSNDINYDKFSLRSNIGGKISDNLDFEVRVLGMMDEKDTPAYGSFDLIRGLFLMRPIDPIYDDEEKGHFYQPVNTGLMNPVAIMEKDNVGYGRYRNKWFQSSMSLTYNVPFIEGLSVSGMYSYDYTLSENKNYWKTWTSYTAGKPNTRNNPSSVGRAFYNYNMNLWNANVDYVNEFNGHNVGVHLIYEESWRNGDNFSGSKELSLPIDQVFAGKAENQKFQQSTDQNVLYERSNRALIGRFNYDYQSKYLMEFAFRYEGSSMFPKESRWKFFPSVSAGWRISEESFFKNSALNFIDNLKLRASYGILGDDSVLAYQFLQGYLYPSGGYVFDNNFVGGVNTRGPANRAISWVKAQTFNVGIDFDAWNGKLGVVAEYFFRERSGLLATRNESLPGIVGTQMPRENLNGDLSQGYEIELSHRNSVNDFNYQIKGNLAFTTTKNLYVERSESGNSFMNWRQNPTDRVNNIWWGYSGDGRFENWDQIQNHDIFIGRGTILGDYKYEDWNGDGMISDLDVHPIAHTGNRPMMNFGITLAADYKGFDLNVLFQGAAMRHISYVELLYEPLWAGTNAMQFFMDRWHPEDVTANPYDPATKWVKGTYGHTGSRPDVNSTYNMQNAAYMRLKNIELGYSLPKKLMKKAGIDQFRIFVSAYNLLTFSGMKYLDPEFPSSSWGYNYPLNKTVSLGLNLKF